MKKAPPAQVAVLSIVAIGAIGYLVSTFLNLSPGGLVRALVEQAEPQDAQGAEAIPVALIGDSFSHPRLIELSLKAEKASAPAAAPPRQGGSEGYSGLDPLSPPRLPGTLEVRPEEQSGPVENTDPSRQQPRDSHVRVALTAIVKVEKPVAFLSLDGGESRAFRKGDRVVGDIVLVAIEESRVVLRRRGRSFEILIGEEYSR